MMNSYDEKRPNNVITGRLKPPVMRRVGHTNWAHLKY